MRWKCHLTSNLHVLHWQTAFILCAKLPHSFHYFVMSVIFSDFVSYWQCSSCKAYVVESTRVLCLFVCNINFPVCRMTSDGGSGWERKWEVFAVVQICRNFWLQSPPRTKPTKKQAPATRYVQIHNETISIRFYCIQAFIDLILLCGRVCHSACSTFLSTFIRSHHAKTQVLR